MTPVQQQSLSLPLQCNAIPCNAMKNILCIVLYWSALHCIALHYLSLECLLIGLLQQRKAQGRFIAGSSQKLIIGYAQNPLHTFRHNFP